MKKQILLVSHCQSTVMKVRDAVNASGSLRDMSGTFARSDEDVCKPHWLEAEIQRANPSANWIVFRTTLTADCFPKTSETY